MAAPVAKTSEMSAKMSELNAKANELSARMLALEYLAQASNHDAQRKAVRRAMRPPDCFEGGPRIEGWLWQMENFLDVHGVTVEDDRVMVTMSYLRGTAYELVRWCSGPDRAAPDTMASLRKALVSAFAVVDRERKARAELAALEQGETPLEEHTAKFLSLWCQLQSPPHRMDQAAAVWRYFESLRALLQAVIWEHHGWKPECFETVQELRIVATRIDRAMASEREGESALSPTRGGGGPPRCGGGGKGRKPGKAGCLKAKGGVAKVGTGRLPGAGGSEGRPGPSAVVAEAHDADIECFRCHKKGHIARTCLTQMPRSWTRCAIKQQQH